ncbi:MAG: ABZJ_00895 family protein [Pseudomonadota bacterium]
MTLLKNPYILFALGFVGVALAFGLISSFLGGAGGSGAIAVAPMVAGMLVGQQFRRANQRLYENKEAWVWAARLAVVGLVITIVVLLTQLGLVQSLGLGGIVFVLVLQYVLLVLFTRLGLNLGGKRELEAAAKTK